jgi:cellobiose epimerase
MHSFRMSFALLLLQCVAAGYAAAQTAPAPAPSSINYLPANKETYLKLAKEMDATLDRDILNVWFPRSLDNEHGGFRSNFSRDWKPFGQESKFSVFQGRMTWISSQIVVRRPELKQQYLPYVTHGIDYLTGTLWEAGSSSTTCMVVLRGRRR